MSHQVWIRNHWWWDPADDETRGDGCGWVLYRRDPGGNPMKTDMGKGFSYYAADSTRTIRSLLTVDEVLFHGRVENLDEAWRRVKNDIGRSDWINDDLNDARRQDGRWHEPHLFTCWRNRQPQPVSPVRLPDGFRFNRTGWVEVDPATPGLP
ncbi:hypothetical protein [Saccharopolyspora sp. NPDC050642]|uniref:hypothetical protein n=1 Tax=Saccharopolyspora sp. NPDC050642 TaxID=3157099 RepID=UPI0033CE52DB